jgi:hypothetical protein
MVYIYCKRGSDSARALADAIQGKRLRTFDGMNFFHAGKKVKFTKGDCIVAWGEPVPEFNGIRVLNGGTLPNKYKVAIKLSEAGIPTIQVRQARTTTSGWFGRSYFHVGGNDLLTPVTQPDFWVKRENILEEYRIHSFLGKSIRAGKKIVREGYSLNEAEVNASNGQLKLASSWIRSFDGGWRICYDGFQSKKAMRELAHKAVETLGLDFGAVDIGKLDNGNLIVLEVNRAPGLEGGSVEQYAKHVKGWVNNESVGNEEDGVGGGESVQPVNGQANPTGTGAAASQPIVQPTAIPAAAAPNGEVLTTYYQYFNGRWNQQQPEPVAAVPVEPAVPNEPPATPAPAGNDISFDDFWRSISRRPAVSGGAVTRTPNLPRSWTEAASQGVQEGGNGTNAPNTGARPFSSGGVFGLQRRRIAWSRWNNKYNRITDPERRRRVLREATDAAKRGKLPYDPDTLPAQ